MTGFGTAKPGRVGAIIPAGGVGRRFGPGRPKQFLDLAGWPVMAHTLARFDQTDVIDQVTAVVPADQVGQVRKNIVEAFGLTKTARIVPGGETRQESVYQGFLNLEDDVDLVVIHDGVRPLVKVSTIENVVETAREHGAAIAALAVRDTLKLVEDGVIQRTLDRSRVWQAQTPQAFRRDWLAEALARAKQEGFLGTDEAILLERAGRPVRVTPGAAENIKITMPEDLILAECIIAGGRMEPGMRVGMGFDVHRFTPGRKLMLGGVEIPFPRGLAGHSDADVMVHALCDALLGAAGLGDIGRHFPDTSPDWADAPGARLLELTGHKIKEAGFELVSADLILMAQQPKIKDFAGRMAEAMGRALSTSPSRINIKATTTEGLGPIGREEGLSASAVALLSGKNRFAGLTYP